MTKLSFLQGFRLHYRQCRKFHALPPSHYVLLIKYIAHAPDTSYTSPQSLEVIVDAINIYDYKSEHWEDLEG